MKSIGFFPLVTLLALASLALWSVEGATKMPVKAGLCPPRTPAQCFRHEPAECQHDWQCEGKKRCCPDVCGVKCLDPVSTRASDNKPGKCPVVLGRCLMLNPPNRCEKDSQCQDDFKCCEGMCGKICMAPEKAQGPRPLGKEIHSGSTKACE
ncbi:antileukoproteinase-like [Rhynchocyon petersi]